MSEWKNQLYFGDNLDILREHIPSESVDLIYLDPPFNSKATYNVLFDEKTGERSAAQIMAFGDTWHWGLESEQAYREMVTKGPNRLADLLQALRTFLGQNDMMAYLVMMAIRLVELHRVLKPTGSIYLHCDPTASHYLKLIMDAVFSPAQFLNEIVWCYNVGGKSKRHWARKHDIILFYSKGSDWFFDGARVGVRRDTGDKSFGGKIGVDEQGRRYQDKLVKASGKYYRYYLDEPKIPEDWWVGINSIQSQASERLGYPTQKPETLLERIIQASSNEGDLVLDPFCGCGTTVAVAERLRRRWIGMDITYLAVNLMKRRLADTFKSELSSYQVIGDPKDLHSAEALALESRHQFEWWAVDMVDAKPAQDKRKGADTGIDGCLNFFDDNSGKVKTVIVQVKSGHVTASQIRDLKGVMEREKAVMGAFLTLSKPTKPMIQEAASSGFYESKDWPGQHFPRLQILTVEELLEGKKLKYPSWGTPATYKRATRKGKGGTEQQQLT